MKIDLNKSESLQTAIRVLEELNVYGASFIVGGAVRDLIMGVDAPNDYDYVTTIPMDVLESNFQTANIGMSRDFGILSVIIDSVPYEVAQLREDSSESDGRHPAKCKLINVSIEADSTRRDLTINSLYLDIYGNVLDFHGGIQDINDGIIRFVGNPLERMEEDALRLIRVLRFAATTDMEISEDTHEAISRHDRRCYPPRANARSDRRPHQRRVSERCHSYTIRAGYRCRSRGSA